MERGEHWRRVYRTKAPKSVSWYQPIAEPSLAALDRLGAEPACSLIDVGGGASSLVDALLDRGWLDLTVLDIAEPALEAARARLGDRAAQVQWIAADVTEWQPERFYAVWHDRAVFHFLTAPSQRAAYRRALEAAMRSGGLAILATFAPDGPEQCSGLPVRRYDADGLAAELGGEFALIEQWREAHVTTWGAAQSFQWVAFRRI